MSICAIALNDENHIISSAGLGDDKHDIGPTSMPNSTG